MTDFIINHEILLVVIPIVVMSPYLLYKTYMQGLCHDRVTTLVRNDDEVIVKTKKLCSDSLEMLARAKETNEAIADSYQIMGVTNKLMEMQTDLAKLAERSHIYVKALNNGSFPVGSILCICVGIAIVVIIYKYGLYVRKRVGL